MTSAYDRSREQRLKHEENMRLKREQLESRERQTQANIAARREAAAANSERSMENFFEKERFKAAQKTEDRERIELEEAKAETIRGQNERDLAAQYHEQDLEMRNVDLQDYTQRSQIDLDAYAREREYDTSYEAIQANQERLTLALRHAHDVTVKQLEVTGEITRLVVEGKVKFHLAEQANNHELRAKELDSDLRMRERSQDTDERLRLLEGTLEIQKKFGVLGQADSLSDIADFAGKLDESGVKLDEI